MNVSYVDLVLNHWPTSPATPTVDPLCDPAKNATYDAKACRLSTWRAYVEIFSSGKARAIGVANYGISDLQEIIDAGMPLPALNQVPYHLYNAAHQQPLKAFCDVHGIVLLSYSPFGIPDWHAFPTPALPSNSTLTDPVVLSVAAAHAPATPAQVLLAWLWQQGMPSNPRASAARVRARRQERARESAARRLARGQAGRHAGRRAGRHAGRHAGRRAGRQRSAAHRSAAQRSARPPHTHGNAPSAPQAP